MPELCPTCKRPLERPKSSPANRYFHKLVQVLAAYRSVDFDLMKRYCKLCAVSWHDYACSEMIIDGHKLQEPKSISRATQEDMNDKLIPTCLQLCMDWGCPIPQQEEGY